MSRKIDWKDLAKQSGEIVTKEQNAAYEFLRGRLGGVGVATVSKLLKRLEVKGLVRQGKGRRWIVIVNPDGTPKNEADIPPKRRFKTARRQLAHINGAAVDALTATDATKIELLERLAGAAEGQKALVLREILIDFRRFSKDRKLLDALRD